MRMKGVIYSFFSSSLFSLELVYRVHILSALVAYCFTYCSTDFLV